MLIVALLAAACTSSGTTEPAAVDPAVIEEPAVEPSDVPQTPFALLPADGEDTTDESVDAEPAAEPTTVVAIPTPVPTNVPRDPSVAWSAAESTRDVTNFLEALRAGAYEQAAWPAFGNGVLFDGQTVDTTGADFLANACAGGLCDGPYLVRGQPGFVDDETMRAVAMVVVTHLASGQQSQMPIVTFEGQRIIGNLPPLVAGRNEATLRQSLFGDAVPAYVVIERFEAFEVWDGETTSWFTNWHAESARQIEGDILTGATGTFSVTDPQLAFDVVCPQLLERSGSVLALNGCVTDGWAMQRLLDGESVEASVPFPVVGETQSPWLIERGGTVLTGLRDAEGNLSELFSDAQVELLNGDKAGTAVLSVDGAHLAYVDHGDPAAESALWSPVVVVREIATGDEVGRWTLNGAAICLEFAVEWVVACEADDTTLVFGDPDQRSLVAINVTTGQLTAVPTANKVFLPTPPS